MADSLKSIAVLVHACDRYEFLFEGFAHFFHQHWDQKITCSYYFATEEIDREIPGFISIKSGKGEWSDRLTKILRDDIKEDYVLYLQEDMWLSKNVNPDFFSQLFQYVVKNNCQMLKLHSSEIYVTKSTGTYIEGFEVTTLDNSASRFLMSHQITLWNKDFLLEQLHPGEHPWRNERRATKRMKKNNPVIHHIDYFAENGKSANNNNKQMIGRSEYRTVSLNAMLNRNVLPYIAQLKQGGDSQKKYAASLQLHLDQELTHDGKDKPRKDGIFKLIKLFFVGK